MLIRLVATASVAATLREAERAARQRKDDFLAPFTVGVQRRR